MKLTVKGILVVDINKQGIRIVEITLTIHAPHHPATHTDIHTGRMDGGPRDKAHEEQKTDHEEHVF